MMNFNNDYVNTQNDINKFIDELFGKLSKRKPGYGGIICKPDGSLMFCNEFFTGKVLKMYFHIQNNFFDEKSFTYHFLFWKKNKKNYDYEKYKNLFRGFIVIDRNFENIINSSVHGYELCCVAFIALDDNEVNYEENLQSDQVVCLQIKFDKENLAVAIVQDKEVYELFKMEGEEMKEKYKFSTMPKEEADHNEKQIYLEEIWAEY